MPRHSHTKDRFEAKRIFTNRQKPLALAWKAIGQEQVREEYRVVSWYGVGGQGKSSLCKEIAKRFLDNEEVLAASLDFEEPEHRRLEGAMLKLRGDLGKSRTLAFPMFDLAYATYFSHQYGKDIRKVHPQLFREGESEIVDDLIDWAEAGAEVVAEGAGLLIPGANLIYKYGMRLKGRLQDWWSRQAVKDQVAKLNELSTGELASRLPEFLGFDLWMARENPDCPRIVISIDTYEKLWASEGAQGAGETLTTDQWVRRLADECPGVLFFIFGRDKLRWADIDPDWADLLDQHLLGGLSDEDANRFLEAVPITDPAIRTRIIEGSSGLPYYLDLAVDQFVVMREKGQAPSRDAFGTTPAAVTERFLAHLGEEERRDLRLASYPAKLDEALFTDLVTEFFGGAAMGDWARLKRRSVMTREEDGSLAMHALMREALQQQERTERAELYKRVHRHLFEHYDGQITKDEPKSLTPDDDRLLLAAGFHVLTLGADDAIEWLRNRFGIFEIAARWQAIEEIFQRFRSLPAIPPEDRAWLDNVLGNCLHSQGRPGEAEFLYRKAIKTLEAQFGEGHTETLASLNNLAVTLADQGRRKEAEELHRKVLDIRTALLGEVHPATTLSQSNLAGELYRAGKLHEAEALHRKALVARQKSPDAQPWELAQSYEGLAVNVRALGRMAEAEEFLRLALELNEAHLGEHHPDTAITCDNLGSVLRDCGRLPEAKEFHERCLAIRKACLGEEHPALAVSYANLALDLEFLGFPEEAETLFFDALEVTRRSLGDNHPDTATCYNNCASNLLGSGSVEEALDFYLRAQAIEKDVLGDVHPSVATNCSNIAQALAALERLEEAETYGRKALEIRQSLHGDDNPDTALAYANLASIIAQRGRASEAVSMARKALAIRERVFGKEHPDTANSYHNLAVELWNAEQDAEVEDLFREALRIRTSLFGEEHPLTIASRSQYGHWLHNQNRIEDAVQCLEGHPCPCGSDKPYADCHAPSKLREA
jgi:tetratricopeptide (TPR) repeat protein